MFSPLPSEFDLFFELWFSPVRNVETVSSSNHFANGKSFLYPSPLPPQKKKNFAREYLLREESEYKLLNVGTQLSPTTRFPKFGSGEGVHRFSHPNLVCE